jgi:hypothetical protein
MSAFRYPSQRHTRRHGPRGYAQYESYRPWLRDEFDFRCVYCMLRERWGQMRGAFDLDHFLPVSTYPDQERSYDNLVYACTSCNIGKRGKVLPNPCEVLLDGAVTVREDSTIEGRTKAARRLIREVGLDDVDYTELRNLWLGIISLAKRYDADLYRRLLGFPDDLPNLARLRPPGGNARPDGVHQSYSAQKQQGTLPEMY